MEQRYTVVTGGVNVDIGGSAFSALVDRDSNPGRVRMSLGGVGRNIAHNLALLGANVKLFTAFGDDLYAHHITASCNELHIDIRHALRLPDENTSIYLFISGPDGDMALAVSDMEICEKLTTDFFKERQAVLDGAQLVVTDTNLPEQSLVYLAEHCTVPLFADPVSTAKAEKLRPILGKLHTLKPNRIEAELLSGVAIRDRRSLELAADKLLETGLKRLFLSLGSDGVFVADEQERFLQPCCPATMRNATGAGDAFMATLAWAYGEDLDLHRTAQAAAAAAAIAVEGEQTINPLLSAEAVKNRISAFRK